MTSNVTVAYSCAFSDEHTITVTRVAGDEEWQIVVVHAGSVLGRIPEPKRFLASTPEEAHQIAERQMVAAGLTRLGEWVGRSS
jgi:hypothetical protein